MNIAEEERDRAKLQFGVSEGDPASSAAAAAATTDTELSQKQLKDVSDRMCNVLNNVADTAKARIGEADRGVAMIKAQLEESELRNTDRNVDV